MLVILGNQCTLHFISVGLTDVRGLTANVNIVSVNGSVNSNAITENYYFHRFSFY